MRTALRGFLWRIGALAAIAVWAAAAAWFGLGQ